MTKIYKKGDKIRVNIPQYLSQLGELPAGVTSTSVHTILEVESLYYRIDNPTKNLLAENEIIPIKKSTVLIYETK